VPGEPNVALNTCPFSRIALPWNAPALSGVTVCCSGSLPIVQVTVSPALIVTDEGENANWTIVTAAPAARLEPAAARAMTSAAPTTRMLLR
jgi:hypothetical protein